MAFNEQLSDRIREALAAQPDVEEKYMFGGVCYMVNGKMCTGVIGQDMMCRIDPLREEELLERPGCRRMDFTSRPMKGYLYVSEEGTRRQRDLLFWITQCLDYNPSARASPKRKRS